MKPNKYPFRERNMRLSVGGGFLVKGWEGSCSQFYSSSLKSIGTHTCTHTAPIAPLSSDHSFGVLRPHSKMAERHQKKEIETNRRRGGVSGRGKKRREKDRNRFLMRQHWFCRLAADTLHWELAAAERVHFYSCQWNSCDRQMCGVMERHKTNVLQLNLDKRDEILLSSITGGVHVISSCIKWLLSLRIDLLVRLRFNIIKHK